MFYCKLANCIANLYYFIIIQDSSKVGNLLTYSCVCYRMIYASNYESVTGCITRAKPLREKNKSKATKLSLDDEVSNINEISS